MRGIGRRELLLDFLAAGQVREDGGAFYRRRALEVEASLPGCGGCVLGWGIAGAEVEEGDFVGCRRRVRWCVDEGAVRGLGDVRVIQDAGEGEVEGWDLVGRFEAGGEGELVEYVGFGVLDYEEDAEGVGWIGFGGTIGDVGGAEAEGQIVDAGVWRERGGLD